MSTRPPGIIDRSFAQRNYGELALKRDRQWFGRYERDPTFRARLDEAVELLLSGIAAPEVARTHSWNVQTLRRWARRMIGPRRPGRSPASGIRPEPLRVDRSPDPESAPCRQSSLISCGTCCQLCRVEGGQFFDLVATDEVRFAIYEPHRHQPAG